MLAGGVVQVVERDQDHVLGLVGRDARAVNEFNRTHPKICVTLQNNGAANDEYVKIGNTLKAKSGAPDIAEVEYFSLPSFEITKSLVDLTKYGVNDLKSKIAPVAWQQASQGSAVYAMPVDLGRSSSTTTAPCSESTASPRPPRGPTSPRQPTSCTQPTRPRRWPTSTRRTPQAVLALMQEDNAFPFTYTGGSSVGINFTGARRRPSRPTGRTCSPRRR